MHVGLLTQHCLHTVGTTPGSEQSLSLPLCEKRSFVGHVYSSSLKLPPVAFFPPHPLPALTLPRGAPGEGWEWDPFPRVLASKWGGGGGVSRKSKSLGDPRSASSVLAGRAEGATALVLSDDTVLVAATSSSLPRPVFLCLPLSQSIYK